MSSVRLHNFFWFICLTSMTSSLICMYFLIIHLKMGYMGMIIGYGFNFMMKIFITIIILSMYAEKKFFFIPKASEIFKDFGIIIKFSLNYSIGYYTVSLTFELVSLILIKTENGRINLLIWISLAQLINAIYYVGYGIGSYGRVLGNHFIGIGNAKRFKNSFFKCIMYHSLITYIMIIPIIIFAPMIGSMFMDDSIQINEFTFYLRLLCFFLPLDSVMPIINSYMRMLSHNFFTMCLMIIGFSFVITGTSFVLCFYYNAGTFGPVCGLIICNILVVSIGIFRVYLNIDYYLDSVIQNVNDLSMKNEEIITRISENNSVKSQKNIRNVDYISDIHF